MSFLLLLFLFRALLCLGFPAFQPPPHIYPRALVLRDERSDARIIAPKTISTKIKKRNEIREGRTVAAPASKERGENCFPPVPFLSIRGFETGWLRYLAPRARVRVRIVAFSFLVKEKYRDGKRL